MGYDSDDETAEPPDVDPETAAAAEQLLLQSRRLCREAYLLANSTTHNSHEGASSSGGVGGAGGVLTRTFNFSEQLADCLGQLRTFWGPEVVGDRSALLPRRRFGPDEFEASLIGSQRSSSSGLAGRRYGSASSGLAGRFNGASSGVAGRHSRNGSSSGIAGRACPGSGIAGTWRKSHQPVTIDSFEILKPISRGAYGHVVLAAKKTTRDLYAIKVMRKSHTRRKNNLERIKTERQVSALTLDS
eukprot:scaffold126537_cov30-Tisochrysis_lutea.AAC.2